MIMQDSISTCESSQQSPLALDSQTEKSIKICGCKWAWCRESFISNVELVNHVIHDHARRAIPVRRRDLPLIRRAEEGTGESFKLSYSITAGESSFELTNAYKSSGESQTRKSISAGSSQEHSGSLPSPPISNIGSLTPETPHNAPSFSKLPARDEDTTSHTARKSYPFTEYKGEILESQGPQGDTRATTPTFASLGSPSNPPALLVIPKSPSFNSLVSHSLKRKLTFATQEDTPSQKSATGHRNLLPKSQSSSSISSTGSRLSVEEQLTQSPEEENSDQDTHDDDFKGPLTERKALGNVLVPPTPSPVFIQLSEYLFKNESPWRALQPESSQSHSSFAADTPGLEFNLDDGGITGVSSQPPSQFQIPVRYHGSKSSTSSKSGSDAPESSAPLAVTIPLAPASQDFAASTPQRQNWYQPMPKRARGSKKATSDVPLSSGVPTTPVRNISPTHTRVTRSSSKTRKFKSDNFQVTPAKPASIPIQEEPEENMTSEQTQDGQGLLDSQTDSHTLEDFSYPLLTQAPYHSQS